MCHHKYSTPGHCDPARLDARFIVVRSDFGRLLFTMLPQDTAQQWVAEGQAYVEASDAIRFYDHTHTREECTPPRVMECFQRGQSSAHALLSIPQHKMARSLSRFLAIVVPGNGRV